MTINELLMGYVIALSALVIWKALELQGISPIGLLQKVVYKTAMGIISVICLVLMMSVVYVCGTEVGTLCRIDPQLTKMGIVVIIGFLLGICQYMERFIILTQTKERFASETEDN